MKFPGLLRPHKAKIFWALLGIITFVKIYWAVSREIFLSGPDSPTYLAMASDIVRFGFFSSNLTGVPIWSQGYSTFLAGLLWFFGANYILLAQVIQIVSFSFSIELFRRISISAFNFNESKSFVYGSILALQPASFFFPQEAMYETLLIPFLALFLHGFFSNNKTSIWTGAYTSLAMVGLLVVHQRTLPIVLIAILVFRRRIPRFFWRSAIIFSPLIAAFIFRNGVYYGSWTLTGAGNGVFAGLGKIFSGRFSEFFVNLSYFWSSYSGYSKRGTWYHNATFQFYLDSWLSANALMILGFLGCVLVICLVAIGLLDAFQSSRGLFWFCFLAIMTANLIDGLTVGDSRHRLIFVPILVALALNSEKILFRRIKYAFKRL